MLTMFAADQGRGRCVRRARTGLGCPVVVLLALVIIRPSAAFSSMSLSQPWPGSRLFGQRQVSVCTPRMGRDSREIALAASTALAEEAAEFSQQGTIFPETSSTGAAVATFAGGCFWGAELRFQRERGVLETLVGYTQGTQAHPTYKDVCDELTGHTEAVLLTFDPALVSYQKLCSILFDEIIRDPTQLNRVGNDRGTQYRTGLYAHSEAQLVEAQSAFDREAAAWRSSGRTVVTEVKRAEVFWPAEEWHQAFLAKGGQSAEKGETDPIRCYG